MNNLTRTAFILFALSIAFLVFTVLELKKENRVLKLEVSKLEILLSKNDKSFRPSSIEDNTKEGIIGDNVVNQPVNESLMDIEESKSEKLPTTTTEPAISAIKDNDVNPVNTLEHKFKEEEANHEWSISYEDKIIDLFNESDRLKDMTLISSECKSETCKIVIARSTKGSFVDATTFNGVISSQSWHVLNDFSFQFGVEGEEDYVTMWFSRK